MDEKIIGNMISVKKVDVWFTQPETNYGRPHNKNKYLFSSFRLHKNQKIFKKMSEKVF